MSFDPTTYNVTEGEGVIANLMLVRSGDLTRTVVVNVTTAAETAMGMTLSTVILQACMQGGSGGSIEPPLEGCDLAALTELTERATYRQPHISRLRTCFIPLASSAEVYSMWCHGHAIM